MTYRVITLVGSLLLLIASLHSFWPPEISANQTRDASPNQGAHRANNNSENPNSNLKNAQVNNQGSPGANGPKKGPPDPQNPPPPRPPKPKSPQTDQGPKSAYLQAIVQLAFLPADMAAPDAQEIKTMLGNPTPFSLESRGSTILVYSTKPKLSAEEAALLSAIKANIVNLRASQQRTKEVLIAHASALGDFVKEIQNLNYAEIKVEGVGPDKIRIIYDANVSQARMDAFLRDVRHLTTRIQPDSPVARLFFLNASDVTGVLGQSPAGSPAPKPDNPAKSPADKPSGGTPDKKSADDSAADTSTGKQSSPKPKPSSPSAAGSESGSGDNNGISAPSLITNRPQDTQVGSLNNDLLVFSNTHPGDDADITERKRILAAVDFPRPEVIINTFSFQTSSSNPDTLYETSSMVRHEMSLYNDGLQAGMARAWKYLEVQMSTGSFLNAAFVDYLTKYYVADSSTRPATDSGTTQEPSASPGASPGPTTDSSKTDETSTKFGALDRLASLSGWREKLGICDEKKYCLGYTSLFHPIRPSLTDMLLVVIAANAPAEAVSDAIDEMEGKQFISTDTCVAKGCRSPRPITCEQKSCNMQPAPTCEETDEDQLRAHDFSHDRFIFPMNCFRATARQVFGIWPSSEASSPSLAAPLRAALANFLFNYKMSQQYPHEFSPYDLSESAQELNSELNPLVVAFNRDLAAALRPLKDAADPRKVKRNGRFGFAGHGTTFVNNGIITVRTISGKLTKVDTVTQNFFDATNPPSITDLVNSVGAAESNVPKVLKANLTANEAAVIIGALNSVKPAQSKIGREFNIVITPRSLSGASAAELEIKLTAKDNAEATLYTNGKEDQDNTSRVSQHDTETKVRLESAKLFEISSFTAMLQRSRRNFPILPPFVEIPYVGSFISVPIPGAKEYHASTAIMTAVIVPTAADLANGLRFTADRIATANENNIDGKCLRVSSTVECTLKKALSTGDLGIYSTSAYHRAIVSCFGSGFFYPSSTPNTSPIHCEDLHLDDILPERE